jgi:hypothetical protein
MEVQVPEVRGWLGWVGGGAFGWAVECFLGGGARREEGWAGRFWGAGEEGGSCVFVRDMSAVSRGGKIAMGLAESDTEHEHTVCLCHQSWVKRTK